MRTLPSRMGTTAFLDQRAEDLSQVQEPLLEYAKEGRQVLTASHTECREGNRPAGDVIG